MDARKNRRKLLHTRLAMLVLNLYGVHCAAVQRSGQPSRVLEHERRDDVYRYADDHR